MVDSKTPHRLLFIVCVGLMHMACGPGSQRQQEARQEALSNIPHEPLSGDALLVPGESAGDIHLFEADSLLFEALGQPDFSDAAMGKALLVWNAPDDSLRYPLSVFTARDMGNDETARIQRIRITAPFFTTADGICATSTLDEIAKHYETEPVETYEVDGQQYTIYESKAGIAFEVGPDDRSVAVIIHTPGADSATYLPLRSFE